MDKYEVAERTQEKSKFFLYPFCSFNPVFKLFLYMKTTPW